MNTPQMNEAKAQFQQALESCKLKGRMCRYDRRPLSDDGKLLVRYRARKRSGEMFAPVVQFTIELDEGLDLYNLKVEGFNSDMDEVFSKQYDGLYSEDFANFSQVG